VDSLGHRIHAVDLPAAYGSPDWNGGLAAPTIDNIDADADLEVVINTAHSGFVAYDLPGTAGARILWQTGRGNYRRNGVGAPVQTVCTADRDADGDVDGVDLALWGTTPAMPGMKVMADGFGSNDCP
jgi:hypothetical protein